VNKTAKKQEYVFMKKKEWSEH